MTKLGFDTLLNEVPSYFIEKIWKGLTMLSTHMDREYIRYQERHLSKFGTVWEGDRFTEFLNPKIHTLRKDPENLWNAGADLRMVINKGNEDEFQFTPTLKCTGIQLLDLKGVDSNIEVRIDGQLLSDEESHHFAVNDGFSNLRDLTSYFNGRVQAKIVHWTGFRY